MGGGAGMWDRVVRRVAGGPGPLEPGIHRFLSTHPDRAVRAVWYCRADAPEAVVVARLGAEVDTALLLELAGSESTPPACLAHLARHRYLEVALAASLTGACPDEVAAESVRAWARARTEEVVHVLDERRRHRLGAALEGREQLFVAVVGACGSKAIPALVPQATTPARRAAVLARVAGLVPGSPTAELALTRMVALAPGPDIEAALGALLDGARPAVAGALRWWLAPRRLGAGDDVRPGGALGRVLLDVAATSRQRAALGAIASAAVERGEAALAEALMANPRLPGEVAARVIPLVAPASVLAWACQGQSGGRPSPAGWRGGMSAKSAVAALGVAAAMEQGSESRSLARAVVRGVRSPRVLEAVAPHVPGPVLAEVAGHRCLTPELAMGLPAGVVLGHAGAAVAQAVVSRVREQLGPEALEVLVVISEDFPGTLGELCELAQVAASGPGPAGPPG